MFCLLQTAVRTLGALTCEHNCYNYRLVSGSLAMHVLRWSEPFLCFLQASNYYLWAWLTVWWNIWFRKSIDISNARLSILVYQKDNKYYWFHPLLTLESARPTTCQARLFHTLFGTSWGLFVLWYFHNFVKVTVLLDTNFRLFLVVDCN